MGSFTPGGGVRFATAVPLDAPFVVVAVLIAFSSNPLVPFTPTLACAGNTDQFLRGLPGSLVVHQVRDARVPQQLDNAFVHTGQRFFDGAAGGQVADAGAGGAGGDKQRPINRPNY